MPNGTWPKATLIAVASFPENVFLENLAVRADNAVRANDSVLITALNRKQLWYAGAQAARPGQPLLLHTFGQLALSLTEAEPDAFHLCTSNVYTITNRACTAPICGTGVRVIHPAREGSGFSRAGRWPRACYPVFNQVIDDPRKRHGVNERCGRLSR